MFTYGIVRNVLQIVPDLRSYSERISGLWTSIWSNESIESQLMSEYKTLVDSFTSKSDYAKLSNRHLYDLFYVLARNTLDRYFDKFLMAFEQQLTPNTYSCLQELTKHSKELYFQGSLTEKRLNELMQAQQVAETRIEM